MKLTEYLTNNKITKAEFSRKLGVSEHHLFSILAGRRGPSLPLAQKIHRLTFGKVSLLDWTEAKERKNVK